MKPLLIALFLSIANIIEAQNNQSCTDLHTVYELYRERLRNDFLIGIGPDQGMSIPAENRNEGPVKLLRWGDSGTHLAAYIMMLATEYLLYAKEGKNTDQTIYELYWALYAFNRLDLTAESYWGGNNSLNGFFMRDDVSTYNIQPAYLDHVNGGNVNHPDIQNFSSDFGNPQDIYDNEESKDQIIQLLVAMALVKVCIPPSTTYKINGVSQTFQLSTNSSIYEEAIQIVHRIITYVYPLSQHTWDAGAWSIFNAADGHEVPNTRGGKMLFESFGYAEVLKYMTGEDLSATCTTWAWYVAWKNWFKDINAIGGLEGKDIDKYCMLATIINPWDFSSQTSNEFTAQTISNLEIPNQFFYAPLIHNLIHPGAYDNDFTKTDYEGMLNTAPYLAPHFGPFFYSSSDNGGYYWSTTSAILHPDRFGASSNADLIGEYNGLDFMLLHNLYYLNKCCPDPLLFQSKLYDNAKPPFKAAYHVRAGNNVGASYTIGPVTVQNGGNVTYLAGTDISLEDGFSVDLGGTFNANIEECCNNTFPDGFVINSFPNLFSPNGDGLNDQLCIAAPLATFYTIRVETVPGPTVVYEGEGVINTSPACIWDGTGAYYQGNYAVIVNVSGCSYQNAASSLVYVLLPNGNKQNDTTYTALGNDSTSVLTPTQIKIIAKNKDKSINQYRLFTCNPNPNKGAFAISYNPLVSSDIEILNCYGISILKSKCNSSGILPVDINHLSKGLYFCKLHFTNGAFEILKIIVQ